MPCLAGRRHSEPLKGKNKSVTHTQEEIHNEKQPSCWLTRRRPSQLADGAITDTTPHNTNTRSSPITNHSCMTAHTYTKICGTDKCTHVLTHRHTHTHTHTQTHRHTDTHT